MLIEGLEVRDVEDKWEVYYNEIHYNQPSFDEYIKNNFDTTHFYLGAGPTDFLGGSKVIGEKFGCTVKRCWEGDWKNEKGYGWIFTKK